MIGRLASCNCVLLLPHNCVLSLPCNCVLPLSLPLCVYYRCPSIVSSRCPSIVSSRYPLIMSSCSPSLVVPHLCSLIGDEEVDEEVYVDARHRRAQLASAGKTSHGGTSSPPSAPPPRRRHGRSFELVLVTREGVGGEEEVNEEIGEEVSVDAIHS
jgi:hypothetical protein